jgi:hypothetical protein
MADVTPCVKPPETLALRAERVEKLLRAALRLQTAYVIMHNASTPRAITPPCESRRFSSPRGLLRNSRSRANSGVDRCGRPKVIMRFLSFALELRRAVGASNSHRPPCCVLTPSILRKVGRSKWTTENNDALAGASDSLNLLRSHFEAGYAPEAVAEFETESRHWRLQH